MTKKYMVAVPNFSEGRRKEVYEAVADQVRNREGVKLIRVEPEEDFNRTVLTIIGEPEPLRAALLDMAAKIFASVDMEKQEGSHPRIGALDIVPILPLAHVELDECIAFAEEFGAELFQRHGVPVYFTGDNARTEEKKSPGFIRKGQYEGLRKLLESNDPEKIGREPDLSKDGKLSPKLGATMVYAKKEGAVAYNVFLKTEDLSIARQIARAVGGSTGGFSSVQAIGVKFPEREGTVISMNLLNCAITPMYRVYERIQEEARKLGVAVAGSEVIGPVRLEYLLNNTIHYLGLQGFDPNQILELHR